MEVSLRYISSSLCFSVTRERSNGCVSVVASRYSSSPSTSLIRFSNRCYVRAQAADHSRERNNFSPHLHNLSEALWKSLPEPVREFPLKEAEAVISHRLLVLGSKALKNFLLVGFFLNFAFDLIFSVLRSKELVVPLGLTIGVIAADFLAETVKEFSQIPEKLLAVGAIFGFIKLLALCVDFPGRIVMAHVSNGGIMQVMWLAKKAVEETDTEKDEL